MNLIWEVSDDDVQRLKGFVSQHQDNEFVKSRIKRNVDRQYGKITRNSVWQEMVSCLLTTQQRSGPDSLVNKFLTSKPFPLVYDVCRERPDLQTFARGVLAKAQLRRSERLADEVTKNLAKLEGGEWNELLNHIRKLESVDSAKAEREVADYVDNTLLGFGPKQSRNMLQGVGVTRYEIPLDSRLIKWLTEFGFPIKLTGQGLSDPAYYCFVLDGFQKLCERSGLLPCVVDAAIFSSYDKGKWTLDNLTT